MESGVDWLSSPLWPHTLIPDSQQILRVNILWLEYTGYAMCVSPSILSCNNYLEVWTMENHEAKVSYTFSDAHSGCWEHGITITEFRCQITAQGSRIHGSCLQVWELFRNINLQWRRPNRHMVKLSARWFKLEVQTFEPEGVWFEKFPHRELNDEAVHTCPGCFVCRWLRYWIPIYSTEWSNRALKS
jgi:hypothetical protein